MGFRFNDTGINYNRLSNAVDAIGPENTGLSHIAQLRLDNAVSRVNQRYINALKVDGIPLTIWIKNRSGYPCTCTARDPNTGGLLAATDSPEGYTSAPKQDKLPSPTEGKYKVTRIKGTKLIPDTTDNEWSQFNPVIDSPLISHDTPVDSNSTVDLDAEDQIIDETEPGSQLGHMDLDEDVDAFFSAAPGGAVFGGDKTACGICFTTGWTGGYKLLNGERIVLESSGAVPYNLMGTELDTNTHPFSFVLSENANVYWTVELPVFAQSWINIRARNNLDPAINVGLEYSTDKQTWQSLTLDALNATLNSSQSVIWYIRPTKIIAFNEARLTHIEMIVITSEPTLSQSPNLTFPTNFDAFDAIINSTFEVAPTISHLPRESVFMDGKYGFMWKVVDVLQETTSKSQIFGYQVSARMVQRHEQLYQLHDLYTEVPAYLTPGNYSTSTQVSPYQNVQFNGLQKVQGSHSVVIASEMSGGQQVENYGLISNYTMSFAGKTPTLPVLGSSNSVAQSPIPYVKSGSILLGPDGNVWITGEGKPNIDAPPGSVYSDSTLGDKTPLKVSVSDGNWLPVSLANPSIYSITLQLNQSYNWADSGHLSITVVTELTPTTTDYAIVGFDISPDNSAWTTIDTVTLPANSGISTLSLHGVVPSGWYYRISPTFKNSSITSASALVLG